MSSEAPSRELPIKSSTAARVALTSGPAAASADARKNKKKKSKPATEQDSTNTEAMIITPPEIQHSLTTISIPAASLTENLHLSQAIAPYTPSDASPTPPPLPSAPFMDEDTPSPPASPTPRRKSAILTVLDNIPLSIPSTETPVAENNAPLDLAHLQPSADPNIISLPDTPHDPPMTSALVARLSAAAARETSEERRGLLHNPLDKYTNADMPLVHDAHPTAILDYIDIQLIAKWEQCPGEKLLAQAFDYNSPSGDHLNGIRSKIFAATTEITQSKEIGVAAPSPSEDAIKSRHFPSAFLIYNLSVQHKELLLSRYVWASQNITFRVIPLNPTCPDFLFTLRDLSTMLEKDVYDLVYSIWNDKNSSDFLTSVVNAAPSDIRMETALNLRTFVASMYVTRLDVKGKGDAPAPRFNVYANGSIIQDDNTWCRIKTYFANRSYSSLLLGRATPQHTPYSCGLCHGADHPRGLCPFPNVIGWNGPPLRPVTNMRRIGNI